MRKQEESPGSHQDNDSGHDRGTTGDQLSPIYHFHKTVNPGGVSRGVNVTWEFSFTKFGEPRAYLIAFDVLQE